MANSRANEAVMARQYPVNGQLDLDTSNYGRPPVGSGWKMRSPHVAITETIGLDDERVTEHPNGRVTVSRSLHFHDPGVVWEGRLIAGNWIES